MSSKPRWDNGGWNVICDQCGRQFKDSELRLRWDGFMVCSGDWEPRQPQDFVHGVADIQAPKWARPEQADHFIWQETSLTDSVSFTESLSFKIQSASALNGAVINSLGLNK